MTDSSRSPTIHEVCDALAEDAYSGDELVLIRKAVLRAQRAVEPPGATPGLLSEGDAMTTMLDQRWNCGLCGWRGTEAQLARHPSGPFGCPQCNRTEWLSGKDTRARTETGITLTTGCPERQECMGCEVELMHVPRCRTCRWHNGLPGYGGECLFASRPGVSAGVWASNEEGDRVPVYTSPDFGCVNWEQREERRA